MVLLSCVYRLEEADFSPKNSRMVQPTLEKGCYSFIHLVIHLFIDKAFIESAL